jgi:PAS domain S-box-containing protein
VKRLNRKPTCEELEKRLRDLEEETVEGKRRRQQLFFLRIIEQATEGIAVSDLEGYLLFVNNAFAAMHGYRPGELVGKHLSVFHIPEQMQAVEEANRVLKSKGRFNGEVWHVRKDGTVFPTLMHNSVLRNDTGEPIGLIATMRDITELKRAEDELRESEERFRLVFESAVDAIFWADCETGIITHCNKAAAALLEKTKDEIIGQHQTTLHAEDKAEYCGSLFIKHAGSTQAAVVDETEVLSKSGKIVPVHITASVTPVGGKRIVQGVFRDITVLKGVEAELREARDELERRVEKRTAELRRVNDQLRQEIRERKWAEEELLIYHQKLQSLASELALAEERERRRIAVEVHDRIAQNLAFAKMSLGTLRASTSSVEAAHITGEVLDLIDETIQDTRLLISELAPPILYELGFVPAVEFLTRQAERRHGIVFSFEDDGQAKPLTDDLRVLLFRAVSELLVNIAKHAQARSAKVSIRAQGDQVCIEVEDDGIGFEMAKVESSASNADCFGFFSIQQRLQPLDGHLSVESTPGHGTRVSIVAPLMHAEEERKAETP